MWNAASFGFICFFFAQRPMLPKWSAPQRPAMARKWSERQRPAAPRSTEAKGGAEAGAKASTGINGERHGTGEAMKGGRAKDGSGGNGRARDGRPKPRGAGGPKPRARRWAEANSYTAAWGKRIQEAGKPE